jgi:GNAT superfamily N-acetyltransferase
MPDPQWTVRPARRGDATAVAALLADGAARLLMDAAMAYAVEHRCAGIELTCGLSPQRESAHHFYRSLGYETTSYRY